MQKSTHIHQFPIDHIRGMVKAVQAQNGGTKGHSKPSTGGTHAGPPPPPQPQTSKK